MKISPQPISRRLPSMLMMGACWVVFIAAVAWPALALLVRSIEQGAAPTGGWTISSRQWGLLLRTVKLAVMATVLCLVLALPAAYTLGNGGGLKQRPLLVGALLALLLCPPMVYVFGWLELFPGIRFDSIGCVAVWALWAWPIPAAIIGTGWRRIGHQTREAALLDTTAWAAFVRVGLPLLLRYVSVSGLLLLALFLGEYSVPHACGINVYATELLGWAQSSSLTIDTLWPALPPAGLILAALAGVYLVWRRWAADEEEAGQWASPQASSRTAGVVTAAVMLVSWGLPLGVLLARLASIDSIVEAVQTYGRDLSWSLGVAVLSGAVVTGMGIGLSTAPRSRPIIAAWALVWGVLPGALVGQGLLAAYINVDAVYGSWLIIALSHVARFGWLGILIAWLVIRSTPSELVAQARIDGAGAAGVWGFLRIPMHLPTLLCCMAIVSALSSAELASTALVRIPSFRLIPHIIIDKFHFFEEQMLISLSMILVLTGASVAALLGIVLRTRSQTQP